MKLRYNSFFHIVAACLALPLLFLLLNGCDKKNEPEPPVKPGSDTSAAEMTLLIYAVASNNLSYDLRNDMSEIYEAANRVKGLNTRVNVLLYNVFPGNDYATLSRLEEEESYYTFKKVKGYDRKLYSTDPERIRQVINDAAEISPSQYNGVVFWSHGTGWTPTFSTHSTRSVSNLPAAERAAGSDLIKSFGADQYMYKTDSCDIDELADAIPAGRFNYIWFDCCYMSGIELMYQLKGKCDYLVAYPTEIMAEGMPYHLTLPMLANEKPELTDAAKTLFNYYINKNQVVTMMVADMNPEKLDRLANVARKILSNPQSIDTGGMYRYSRYTAGPFFDLRQYLVASIPTDREDRLELIAELDSALNDLIITSGFSQTDFRGVEIPVDEVCGISSHIPGVATEDSEAYYRTLDWWKKVYE